MVNICALILLDFFSAANQGAATSNTNTVVIKGYMKIDSGNPPDYITSLLGVSQLIGAVFGSFSCSFLLDRLGFKRLTLISALITFILHYLCTIRVHWAYIFVLRVILGAPSAIISTIVPTWISNIASVNQRGLLIVFFQLSICAGIIFAALILLPIAPNLSNYWASFVLSGSVSLGCFISAIFVPDPTWKCQKKNKEEHVVEQKAEQQDNLEQVSWKELFSDKKYRKCLLMAFFFPLGGQFTGINAVIVFATLIFQKSFPNVQEDLSSTYGSLIVSSVNFVSSIFALPLINRVGRKGLAIGGFTGCMVTHVTFIVIYAINNENPNNTALIVVSVLFLIAFEIGPGPCFYLCCSESFPRNIRARCLAFSYTTTQIANIIVVLIFPFFTKYWGAYLLDLIIDLIATIVLGVVMIETKGKTLQEIEAIMTGQAEAPKGRKEMMVEETVLDTGNGRT